jgi:O-antigen biosynthesis protein
MPILHSNRAGDEALFALDTPTPVRINPWDFYLRGWFVSSRTGLEAANVLGVLVEGSFALALYGLPRPDVARHLNDPNLTNCGFYVRFRGPRRDPRIKLATRGDSGMAVLAEVNASLVPAKTDHSIHIETYEAWLKCREASLFWPQNEVYDRLAALPYRPLVSVILPTFNVDPFLIEQCVQSVLRQQYAHWQLCIVDDCSGPASKQCLQKLAASDERITLATSPQQVGVAEVQNLALQKAQGDFFVTLDQDDELHPCALLEVIRRLNQRDDCEVIYSDEDRTDVYGSRSNPTFKPGIDPDMLLASNYIGRLTALKRATVLSLGGFRSICDGAQEWDLLIRLLEQVGPTAIQHVAKPLYHRRIRQGQPTSSMKTKPLARKISAGVLSDHVARSGVRAIVEAGISPGSFRLKQVAPVTARLAVFILPQDGGFQIAAIRLGATHGREIATYQVEDCAVYRFNGVSPSALTTLSEISEEVFIFINRPLESLNHSFFEELAAQALREECGLVTGVSVDMQGRVLHSGLVYSIADQLLDPFVGFEFSHAAHLEHLNVIRSVEMISDLFFAIRREHLAAVGGLSAVSAGQMPQLVHKLVTNAIGRDLRIIVTPFAIASFHQTDPDVPVDPTRLRNEKGIALNPNLLEFHDLARAMRGVF